MYLSKLMRTLIAAALLFALPAMVVAQGVSTSSMNGKITDESGEALIGANIVALHQPSGTSYGTATDLEGLYRIPSMRVGGPYQITVSYTGYNEKVFNDVYLRLGESFRLNITLEEGAVTLEGVVVTAAPGSGGKNAGASKQISEQDIMVMPTLNRDLKDFTRLTPQVREAFGGGISIAGVNNRYNAIYIDGAVNNDVFGLSSQGTNGGQTGIAPFSVDIIDQVQVVISPYDVSLGGFAGGGINAVTKSGTNTLKGTAYFFNQNQDLAGKTNKQLLDRLGSSEGSKLDDFSQKLYGASLGGPLIKDKVFFFVNAEIRDDQTPSPFNTSLYQGDATASDLQGLRSFLQNQYGYDPGDFGDKVDKLEGLSLFAKLDINLGTGNKLTLRHQFTKAENTNQNGSSNRTINFANNGVYFPSKTNSFAAELNSTFGTKASNNLIVGITSVRDDRDPIGSDFPYVTIFDGLGIINLGSEQFSTANDLQQDIITITDNFKLYKGKHTFTFGTHNEFSSFYNLFIRQNYGVYEFATLADFLAGNPARGYDRSYSLVDNLTGDGSKAAAEFSAMQLGFYAQDEWEVNSNLSLTYGLRLDIPVITTDPATDTYFNSTALPKIEQAYDLQGARAGQMPEGQLMFSPRVGFNYNLNNDTRTVIRGGLGIFTSRIPFVWPGGAFTANGLTIGGLNERNISGPVTFRPDIQNQYTNPDFSVPSGEMNIFTKDFKYPQVFRTSLALDHTLPGGIQATLEGIYTKTLNNVLYTNVNSDPTVSFNWTGNGADDRPVFSRTSIERTYNDVYLASNTNKGYTYNVSASFTKNFDFGLNAFLAYSYGDAQAINEGTSSQNSSQWRGQFNVDGRNNPVLGRSDFALGHRVVSALSYALNWDKAKDITTTFSLFFNGQSGDTYSYTYAGSSARNINNETGSTGRNYALIYVPGSADEINLVPYTSGGVTVSVEEQWARLNRFIQDDNVLKNSRGQYAGKNSNRTPWTGIFDFKLLQDIATNIGKTKNKLQLSVDVFNVANLLNSNWGVQFSNPFAYQLINFEGYEADKTTPKFSFRETNLGKERFFIQDVNSRWRMRLGIRYIFN